MKHMIVAMVLAIGTLTAPTIGVSTAYADGCTQQIVVCPVPPVIDYHGDRPEPPPLTPTVCLSEEALKFVTPEGGDEYWFTYYQRYTAEGGEDDMEPVMRVRCITEQHVFSGTRIGFWGDCNGERWWFETGPITDNGRYEMTFTKKVLITDL